MTIDLDEFEPLDPDERVDISSAIPAGYKPKAGDKVLYSGMTYLLSGAYHIDSGAGMRLRFGIFTNTEDPTEVGDMVEIYEEGGKFYANYYVI